MLLLLMTCGSEGGKELLVAIRNQPASGDTTTTTTRTTFLPLRQSSSSSQLYLLHHIFLILIPCSVSALLVGRSVVGGDFCACHIHRHWLPQSESSTHPPTPHHLVLTSVHVASCSFPTLNIHSTVVVVVLPVVVVVASPSCRVGPVGRGVYTRAKQRAQQVVGFRGPFPFQPPTPFSIRRGRRESPFPTPLSHFITCTLIRPHSLPLICRSVGRSVGWLVCSVGSRSVRSGAFTIFTHALLYFHSHTHSMNTISPPTTAGGRVDIPY